jgi:hypothetical protein
MQDDKTGRGQPLTLPVKPTLELVKQAKRAGAIEELERLLALPNALGGWLGLEMRQRLAELRALRPDREAGKKEGK